MKTSPSQFEMLVNFMETYGDIAKPSKNARGRIKTITSWDKVSALLNADATGHAKTTEKWKKVWSDYKNNVKKKAAKINRAARGTGGGPALLLRLTDLEQRVLNIIGPQAASGLEVVEAGFPQDQPIDDVDRTLTLTESPSQLSEEVHIIESDWNLAGPSHQPHIPPPLVPESSHPGQTEDVHIIESDWNLAGPSHQPHTPPPLVSETYHPVPSPVLQQSPTTAPEEHASFQGPTPRSRRRGLLSRRGRSPRRRGAWSLTHVEQATQLFLTSDQEWRRFQIKKHEDYVEMEQEKLRLRKAEIESQQKWQQIATLAIAALNKIIDAKII